VGYDPLPPAGGLRPVWVLLSAYTFSILLGIYSFLPGGLGVRELVQGYLLLPVVRRPYRPAGAASAEATILVSLVVMLQRLFQVAVEMGMGLLGEPWPGGAEGEPAADVRASNHEMHETAGHWPGFVKFISVASLGARATPASKRLQRMPRAQARACIVEQCRARKGWHKPLCRWSCVPPLQGSSTPASFPRAHARAIFFRALRAWIRPA